MKQNRAVITNNIIIILLLLSVTLTGCKETKKKPLAFEPV